MSAAIWAKTDAVFYGCDIPTISSYLGQIHLRADSLSENGIKNIPVVGNVLEPECRKLLAAYS